MRSSHSCLVLRKWTDSARNRTPEPNGSASFTAALRSLGIEVQISPRPSEVADPVPFAEDIIHSAYDPTWATRFFHVLSQVDLVLKEHRARFRGKTSLVSFFWGTFDLALSLY